MSLVNETYKKFESDYIILNSDDENKEPEIGEVITPINKTNVVSGEKLRAVQKKTLNETKEFLSKTFGPMGSNTKIIKGTNQADIDSIYSKDGLKVLKSIVNSGPIESSIVEELVDITSHVEKEVGDGTTSTVILSSLIFDKLSLIEKKYKIPPYSVIEYFKDIVKDIKESILSDKKDITLDDIYNIAMVSTNGNVEVSTNIMNIYKDYGTDVELSVGISNTSDSVLKVYDGLTITEGMSDPVFINNRSNNTSEIHDASIYHFVDPIDTMDQIVLFESILNHNIYEPLENDKAPIPTVITCPRLSKDMSVSLKTLANHLYQFDQAGSEAAKPPILIISNVVASDEIIMDDIANLCGCKSIRKYIDPEVAKKDQESGEAPTVDNVWEFCGKAELVVADSKKTKFINPLHMVEDENGENKDPIYTAMVNFLETEIEQAKNTESASDIGLLKKRLSALKSNMVDYLVGGVTIFERDAHKDLVEDAIKNCRSASLYGVGYAANFEGLKHSAKIYKEYIERTDCSPIMVDIAEIIFLSYCDIAKILYGTVSAADVDLNRYVSDSLSQDYPFDISSGFVFAESGKNIKCSIMLDINILDTISKIISMMVTCNQCLLQASHLNVY